MNAFKASLQRAGPLLKRVPILVVAFLVLQGTAFAGAWVQEKGRGLGILAVRWYESSERWDEQRDITEAPRYRKFEFNPYIEYGVTERLTAGVNLFLLDIDSAGDDGGGLSDMEFLGRYLLSETDFTASSVQFLVKAPGPYTTDLAPGLGQDQYDIELRLLYGVGGTLGHGASGSGAWYANFEGGLRKRFGPPADEIRLDWAIGWKTPGGRWEFEAKQENIFGLRNAEAPSGEYDLHKFSPAVRFWASGRIGLQAGLSMDLYGRNTGKGKAALAALWIRF